MSIDEREMEQMSDLLWEMFWEYRRLNGYPMPSTALVNKLIDAATGMEEKIMKEFSDWLINDVIPRMPTVDGYQKPQS